MKMSMYIYLYVCADLSYVEKTAGGPELLVACMPKSNSKIILTLMDQRVHIDMVESIMELAVHGCELIMKVYICIRVYVCICVYENMFLSYV